MSRVVVFDFHETLVQLRPSTDAALAEIVGVPADRCRAVFTSVEGRVEALRAAGGLPQSPAERWPLLYGLILEELDLPGQADEVARQMSARFADPACYAEFPDSPGALRALKSDGARVGILSNTDLELRPLLHALGWEDLIDAAIPCYRHGVEKPDPEAFALIAEALDAEPSDAWFVGDSLHHDVLPAAAVGMRPVLVDRHGVHPPSEEYAKVTTLDALPEVLAEPEEPRR